MEGGPEFSQDSMALKTKPTQQSHPFLADMECLMHEICLS